MSRDSRMAQILCFPARGEARATLALLPPERSLTTPWPPTALDGLELPDEDLGLWLEEVLVTARIKSMTFLRALAQLPPPLLSPDLQAGSLRKFLEADNRLTMTLEMLRLGMLGATELEVLLPGLRRAWGLMRALREEVLESLDARARTAVQEEEGRGRVSSIDVERELLERSRRRTLHQDPFVHHLSTPGGFILPIPDSGELQRRERRTRRLEQDHQAVNIEQDLHGWLEILPNEWLEGLARSLSLPLCADRWEQEKAVAERILAGGVEEIVARLLPIERRILREISRADGLLRYDLLILHHGGDDEYAWHWAEEVPMTPLERVRRCGLLFVGRARVGRRDLRVAVVPPELRSPLKSALELHARC